MYRAFYGLKKQPFHITPDPEFLYLSPSHKEALAAIIYGIEQKKGFVTIIGAVGVGKTTILRSYLEMERKKHAKIAYVFNSKLTFEELLRTIYQELGIVPESTDVSGMVNGLYEVLIEEYRQGNTVVLVVDEAQNMPVETLENLRMISNLETSTDKLIQIVLVGQPEFEDNLNSNRLRQLRQRLAIRSTILPLTKDESRGYVRFRLQRAGANPDSVFTSGAIKKIIDKAKGIPRIINVLCDNALITGFGYQQKPVAKKIAKEIIRDLQGKGQPHFARRQFPRAAALVLLLLVFGIVWFSPLRRVAFDYMAILVPRTHTEKADAIRDVRPTEGTATKERQAPGRAAPEVPPHKDEPVVPKALAAADTLLKKGVGTEPAGEGLPKKPTAEHSLLRDSTGKVYGLWLADPADARDRRVITALLSQHGLPAATLLKRGYRVVPNRYDSASGSFVMLGSSTAPGEAAAANKDDAVQAYREALRINPDDATTHYNMGVTLYEKGLLDDAIQAYREALRINPKYAVASLNLGLSLRQKGLNDEAIGAFENFIRYAPPQYAGDVEKARGLVDSLRGNSEATE